jgi:thiol-disulfide isomerase/thioredoxin
MKPILTIIGLIAALAIATSLIGRASHSHPISRRVVLTPRTPPIPSKPVAPPTLHLELDESAIAPPARRRLLVFGARWCGPCLADKPLLESGATKAGLTCGPESDKDVQLIDIDESPRTTARYQVTRLPTAILIEPDGAVVKQVIGAGGGKSLLPQLATPTAAHTSRVIGALSGARSQVAEWITRLRPLLGSGGQLQMTYTGTIEPEISIGGRTIRFSKKTTLTWSLRDSDSTLQVAFQPPPTVAVGLLSVGIRTVRLREDRITVDLPWLPDAEILLP